MPVADTLHRQVVFYVPTSGNDWIERIEAGLQAIERVFDGERLNLARIPGGQGVRTEVVVDRREHLRNALARREGSLALTNGKAYVGYGTEMVDEGHISVAGYREGEDLFGYNAIFPRSTWPLCERLLVDVGDALGAHTAWLSPTEAGLLLRAVQLGHHTTDEDPSWLAGRIPRVEARVYRLRDPRQPAMLGWLNYWSAATCEYVGFPDPGVHRSLLRFSYRTPAGGWMVKISEDPLDLRRAEHLQALEDAYVLLPRVGLRLAATPREGAPRGGSGAPSPSSNGAAEGGREPIRPDWSTSERRGDADPQARTPAAIAETALSLWDMLADEAADERELEKMVTEELVAWGLARRDAERAVAIMNAALGDSAPAAASQRPHTFHDDPLYLAVVAHIRDHMSG